MPIRIIKPPKTIHLQVPDTARRPEDGSTQEMRFADFVLDYLLNTPLWVSDYEHLRAADEIHTLLQDATGGGVELAEETWKKLENAARNPGRQGYGVQPWAMRQLLPYLRAILDAEEKPPKAR